MNVIATKLVMVARKARFVPAIARRFAPEILWTALAIGTPAAVTVTSACTPAARATASTDIGIGSSILGGAAPIGCSLVGAIDPSDPNAVRICGEVTQDVSAVATMVSQILADLPKASRKAAAAGLARIYVMRNGKPITIDAPVAVAQAVAAKLGAGK